MRFARFCRLCEQNFLLKAGIRSDPVDKRTISAQMGGKWVKSFYTPAIVRGTSPKIEIAKKQNCSNAYVR
jgi:hypothetical protein